MPCLDCSTMAEPAEPNRQVARTWEASQPLSGLPPAEDVSSAHSNSLTTDGGDAAAGVFDRSGTRWASVRRAGAALRRTKVDLLAASAYLVAAVVIFGRFWRH